MQKSFIHSGLINYNPNKSFNGYTLYAPMQTPTLEWSGLYSMSSHAYLIDMNGNEVHKWRLPSPPVHGILLENGNLLMNGMDGTRDDPNKPGVYPGAKYPMGGGAGYLFELDWEGNIVFEYHDPSMHHDFDKLPNGNYIFIRWEKVPEEMQREIIGGPHTAYVIPEGCPGAGNYLLYDNGMYADTSRAIEYSKDSTTEKPIVVWESCQGTIGRKHYSNFISGAQRLPNGNTLICDGGMGRFFEIAAGTHDEVVWEFVNPHVSCKIFNGAVFRAHRYGPDHCPHFKTLPPPNK